MADEELHEIQLNGKQLVFLFMTCTVAAVVIFLCGLMVGRNIRSPRLEAAAASTEAVVTDPTRPAEVPPPPTSASTESSTPVTTQETLTYANRLEDPTPVEENLRDEDLPPPAAAKPLEKVEKPAKAAEKKEPARAATAKPEPASATSEPAGNGWAVQVLAVKTRDEADAIARRLSSKGYPTFVASRGAGTFGVRVGKYPNKRDAEAIKTRLEKEEQFKPWVTR